MPRYRVTLEYDGGAFLGWQIQAEGRTVQGAVTEALYRFTGETTAVRGAGRTDTGVHALGQVAHFECAKTYDPFRVREALNFHLKPEPVTVLECVVAAPDFDARFDATRREYLYRILTRRAPPVLDRGRVWWVPRPLDWEKMAEAASVLEGHHDFTTFRAAACQAASPLRTLDRFTVSQAGDEIRIATEARSFLHNQVRSMVGSLKCVGEGRWTRDDLRRALDARDRAACGPIAPPYGLYLARVEYGGT